MEYKKIGKNIHLFFCLDDNKVGVSVEMMFSHGGSLYEEENEKGLSHLLEHCIVKRTKKLKTLKELDKYLFKYNIYKNAYTSNTDLGLSASGHKDDFHKIFDLLFEMFLEPTLDEKELKRERQIVIKEIIEVESDPGYQFSKFVRENLFKKGSFLLLSPYGKKENVEIANIEILKNLYQKILKRSHLFLFFSGGNLDKEYVTDKISSLINQDNKKLLKLVNKENNGVMEITKSEFKKFDVKVLVHEYAHEEMDLTIYVPFKSTFENLPVRNVFGEMFFGQVGGLFDRLRNDLKFVYNVDSFFSFRTNTVTISLKCKIDDTKKVIKEVEDYFSNFDKVFKKSKFEDLKVRTLKSAEMRKDSLGADADMVYGRLTTYNKAETIEEFVKRLGKVTQKDLEKMFNEVKKGFTKKKLVVCSKQERIKEIFKNS